MKAIKRISVIFAVVLFVGILPLFTACYADIYKEARGIWKTDDTVDDADWINHLVSLHDIVEEAVVAVDDDTAYLTITFKDYKGFSSPSIASGMYKLIPSSVESDLITWKLFETNTAYEHSLTYSDGMVYINFKFLFEGEETYANIYFVRAE